MESVYTRLRAWLVDTDEAGVLVRHVGASGSTPRELGAVMLVSASGTVVGSLSGGCVESAAVERACSILDRGEPVAVLVELGVGSDPDLDAGLLCGGTMTALFQTVGPHDRAPLRRFCEAQIAGTPAVLATRLDGTPSGSVSNLAVVSSDSGECETSGSLGSPALDREVTSTARSLLASGGPAVRIDTGVAAGSVSDAAATVILQATRRRPRLVVAGADDFADALARAGACLGWSVEVVDPRAVLATPERFPTAQVTVEWPDRHLEAIAGSLGPDDAVCVLSHDRRIDVPALLVALGTDAGYVGAMGSRTTHEDRLRRLREAGVDSVDLARLHSPIGLDIGAATPEETAVAIVAEIVAVRAGRSGRALRETTGSIRASRDSLVCETTAG